MQFSQISMGMRSFMLLGGLSIAALMAGLAMRGSAPEPLIVAEASIVPSLADLVFEAPEASHISELTVTETQLKRRETLSGLIDRMGVNRLEGAQALASLTDAELLDARRVRQGLNVTLYKEGEILQALSIAPESGRHLLAKRSFDGTYHPVQTKARLIAQPKVIKGTIETSLYGAARELGAGDQQVVDFAQVFAYDVDFQREVHPGDAFEVVFNVMTDERGNVIKRGDVVYAALNGKAVDKAFYRFTTLDDDVTDYFQANGESATKFLMKTPINGARLSSSFGNRRHPISGYNRLHKGTDFAAPTGTPIFAAGHGTVERASRYGGYGNYVRIKHANGYKTAYAHLSRYGSGVKAGRRVRQGDIIGYVGSTGASTGPHLHYEVYINGKPVNAMTLKLPKGRKLAETPEIMADFIAVRDQIDAIREGDISDELLLIKAAASPSP
jgi:murein DD-endopeptidase MepM/ murein hydrolase activator NlpD